MYPTPLAKRQVLGEGSIADYGFTLISAVPTAAELEKWDVSMPQGNSYTVKELYVYAAECAKKYWEFYTPEGYEESFALQDGHFTADEITPERVAAVWLALSMYESGDRDVDYFPHQFFIDCFYGFLTSFPSSSIRNIFSIISVCVGQVNRFLLLYA